MEEDDKEIEEKDEKIKKVEEAEDEGTVKGERRVGGRKDGEEKEEEQ